MKIALATCLEKPEGTYDDQLLRAALVKAGHSAEFRVWNGVVEWAAYDVCLLRSTWDYHRQLPKFVRWLHSIERQIRVVNPADVVEWSADKSYLRGLASRGVSVVPTTVFTDAEQARIAIARAVDSLGRRVVVKPSVSASSELTYRLDGTKDLEKTVDEILKRSPLVLQPYVESIETEGEVSLVFFRIDGKAKYSHTVLKKPKRGEFRVQEDFGGSAERTNVEDSSLRLAEEALQAVPSKWVYARVDIVDWQDQPKVSELELVEPELFFRFNTDAAEFMTEALEEP